VTPALAAVAALIERESGVRLPAGRSSALRTALRRAAPGLDEHEFLRMAGDSEHGAAVVARLLDEATIKETFFYREPKPLEALDWWDLLGNARRQGSETVTVWSAGCATGEEAYTLGMLALEAFHPLPPPVRILATDVSGAALARAQEGRYGPRALRQLPAPLRTRYFETSDERTATVAASVRRLVTFRRHNLVGHGPPVGSPFDVVVCRNVLIYFDAETAAGTCAMLQSALRPGGLLCLGAADRLCVPLHREVAGAPRPSPAAVPPGRPPRKPPAEARPTREQRLALVEEASSGGDHARAVEETATLTLRDPLDAEAHYVQGLLELDRSEFSRAIWALRRALFADPLLAVAAFLLGRAREGLGDAAGARRSYEHALRLLAAAGSGAARLLAPLEPEDVAVACGARLRSLAMRASA
jgi:chemotaxis protein methyltransferase CheR